MFRIVTWIGFPDSVLELIFCVVYLTVGSFWCYCLYCLPTQCPFSPVKAVDLCTCLCKELYLLLGAIDRYMVLDLEGCGDKMMLRMAQVSTGGQYIKVA